MSNILTRCMRFVKARYAPRGAWPTFSQAGEDIVVGQLLKRLGVSKPFYIDIGAHHPIFGNTTYLFYRQGGRGVLIEPNTELCNLIKSKRPHDVCVNAGVGGEGGEANFYIFARSTRSTFSPEQAHQWEATSGQKPRIEPRPIMTLNKVVEMYAKGKEIDLVSIDAEGMDRKIIEAYDFGVRPKIFCIEMAPGLRELMEERGYALAASIFENAVFVDKTLEAHI